MADELELWEIAAVLGLARPLEDAATGAEPETAPRTWDNRRDLVAERLAHAEGKAPAPVPTAMLKARRSAVRPPPTPTLSANPPEESVG